MTKSKFYISFAYILLVGYTVVTWYTYEIPDQGDTCLSKIYTNLLHWSSGCFYSNNIETHKSEESIIKLEAKMLQRYIRNQGVSPEILWYNSKFHQRNRVLFKNNFQDLHRMHQAYTRSEHTDMKRQIDYWQYLVRHDLVPLAQSTLNQYCKTYIPNHRRDIVESIQSYLKLTQIDLSLKECWRKVK